MDSRQSEREHGIEEVALAIHFIQYGREADEPLRTRGGALDPQGGIYKMAVVAVETLERVGWKHG